MDPGAPLVCVLGLVETDLGIPVAVLSLREGTAGCCYRTDGFTMLFVNRDEAVVRQRFTLAHELGHVECGHDGTEIDTVDGLRAPKGTREVEANAFAAELLAPAAGVPGLLDGAPTLEDVVRIAEHFGISAIAALYRLQRLTLVAAQRQEILEREIEAGLHNDVRDRLDLPEVDDGLAQVAADGGVHLSPALRGTELAAQLGMS